MSSDCRSMGEEQGAQSLVCLRRPGGVGGNRISPLRQNLEGSGDCFTEIAKDVARLWEMGRGPPGMAGSHRGQQGHPMARHTGIAATGEEVHPSLEPERYQYLEGAWMLG